MLTDALSSSEWAMIICAPAFMAGGLLSLAEARRISVRFAVIRLFIIATLFFLTGLTGFLSQSWKLFAQVGIVFVAIGFGHDGFVRLLADKRGAVKSKVK